MGLGVVFGAFRCPMVVEGKSKLCGVLFPNVDSRFGSLIAATTTISA